MAGALMAEALMAEALMAAESALGYRQTLPLPR